MRTHWQQRVNVCWWGQPRMRVMCTMKKKKKKSVRGRGRGVCESMNVCMCVLAERMCALLPLIHSQQHRSEPSFPHSNASEKTGPPCWLWSALTGAHLHRSSAVLNAAHHVQRYWHPPAFSVSLPPSLLSSGAAPAAACSLFRGSKKSSRRSKNSSAPALPRLGAACLPACLLQHLNTNKIPHHHHHDDQAAAASSALHLKPWCQHEHCRLGKTTEHLIWWAVEKEQGDHKALTADTCEESLI